MDRPYFSLSAPCEGLWKDRGSSFHARVCPAASPEEVQTAVAAWTALHRGARHHAWAYRIRQNVELEERSHDAGEPSHSAGTPILHALQSAELQDCGAVVSRYFGGVKLGVGGLISAYRGAADDALARCARSLLHPERQALLELPYELLGRMEADAHDERIRWLDRAFTDTVRVRVAVWAESAAYWEQHWTSCYPLKWEWIKDQYTASGTPKTRDVARLGR